VIKTLPNLVKLDNSIISREEREASRSMQISLEDSGDYAADVAPKSTKKVDSPYKEHR
jgi:hypothetical protein